MIPKSIIGRSTSTPTATTTISSSRRRRWKWCDGECGDDSLHHNGLQGDGDSDTNARTNVSVSGGEVPTALTAVHSSS